MNRDIINNDFVKAQNESLRASILNDVNRYLKGLKGKETFFGLTADITWVDEWDQDDTS